MDIFNAVRRKAMNDTMLAPSIDESVKMWMQRLHEKAWFTLFEPTPGEEDCGGFTITFHSPWQHKVFFPFIHLFFIFQN